MRLLKLVVMTNNFSNTQKHESKIKRFICVKQISFSIFSNAWDQRFYS